MPVTSKNETVQEEGQEKQAITFTFTNGAKQQIEELQAFFKQPDSLEIIKLAISVLQKVKEMEEQKRDEKAHDKK